MRPEVALFSSGIVEYRWMNCDVVGWYGVVGWSPGNGARDPGAMDVSASVPFQTEADATPITLSGSRPVLGQTVNLVVGDIPATATSGVTAIGMTQVTPGIDLGFAGAPGCMQHVTLDVLTFLPVSGGTATQSQPVPNSASLAGLSVYAQGAALVSGVNTLGLLTSNGLHFVLNIN